MSSGSDVVGAAMSAPVGSYVIALRTMSEVTTSSRYSPSYAQRPTHSRHHASVRASAESASSTGGVCSYERCHMNVSRSRAPSPIVKSDVTVPSSISSGSVVLRRNASGPDVTRAPSGTGSTHGTTDA